MANFRKRAKPGKYITPTDTGSLEIRVPRDVIQWPTRFREIYLSKWVAPLTPVPKSHFEGSLVPLHDEHFKINGKRLGFYFSEVKAMVVNNSAPVTVAFTGVYDRATSVGVQLTHHQPELRSLQVFNFIMDAGLEEIGDIKLFVLPDKSP